MTPQTNTTWGPPKRTILYGGDGNDSLDAGDGDDNISGEAGNDTLDGSLGNDTLYGDDGDDEFHGGAGDDEIYGGSGSDTIVAGGYSQTPSDGDDTLYGGADTDTYLLSGAFAEYIVTDNGDGSYTVQDTIANRDGTDIIWDIENLQFTDGTVTPSAAANRTPTDITYTGGSVNETIVDGGTIGSAYDPSGSTVATLSTVDPDAGDTHTYAITSDPSGLFEIVGDEVRVKAGSTVDYETQTSYDIDIEVTDSEGETYAETITINVTDYEGSYVGAAGTDSVTGTSEEDYILGQGGADSILGGGGDDTIDGGSGNDTIDGGAGDDDITGLAGDDHFFGSAGSDTYDGGADTDTIDYSGSASAVAVDLAAGTGTGGDAQGDTYTSIETVVGSANSDTLTGDTGDNRLDGNAGDDELYGGDGSDELYGGAGWDALFGEDGADTLYGGAENDTVSGGAGSDIVEGGTGDDYMEGGADADTLRGDEGADLQHGNTGDDTFYATGDDQAGSDGDDTLYGGADTDTYVLTGAIAEYTVTDNGDGSYTVQDTIANRDGTDVIWDIENLQFTDGTVTPSAAANRTPTDITYTGGSVNETIVDGGTIGSAYDPSGSTVATLSTVDPDTGDSHTYAITSDPSGLFEIVGDEVRVKAGSTVDYETQTSYDIDIEVTDSEGETYSETITINVNNAQGSYIDSAAGNYTQGTSEEDWISGNDGADSIDGSDGNDTIYSGLGDDTLDGSFGDDTLYGDDGADALYGGMSDDELHGGNDDDTFVATGDNQGTSDGDDTLYGGTGNDTYQLTGNRADYNITDNGDGTHTIQDTVANRDGTDIVSEIEFFQFADGTVGVADLVNVAPTDITYPSSDVDENSTAGMVVATLSTVDGNPSDTFTYAITSDPSGYFEIVGNEVRVKSGATLDYETDTSHDITVEVTDSGGLTYNEVVTININDVNEAPTDIVADFSALAGGSEFVVNTTTTDIQANPTIVNLSDGGFVVAWQSNLQDGSSFGVYAQRYDAAGAPVGGETQVNTTTIDRQQDVEITALNDGGYIIAWESDNQDGDGYGVYTQRYDAAGAPVGGETQVNTTTASNQHSPTIAGLNDGGYVIAWTSGSQDGDGNGVYMQRYDNAGVPLGSETQVNTTTIEDQDTAAVTVLQNGDFVITWESSNQDGDGIGVYMQRYDSAGVPLGSETQVNTTTVNGQDDPHIAALDNGGFVITWESSLQDGDGNGLYGQIFDSAGNPVGGEFQINTETTDSQQDQRVEALPNGGFIVIWESNLQDGDQYGIYAQQFDASGNSIGNELHLTTTTIGIQADPNITVLDDGRIVAVWESDNNDGDSEGIVGRIFQPGISEDAAAGTVVVTLSSADPDAGDTAIYSLFSDPSGNFEIVGNEVRVKSGATLDYETDTSHDITVRVTDSGGLTYDEVITIVVGDANDAPVVSGPTAFNTDEDVAIVLTEAQLLANASDQDGDTMSVQNVVADQGTLVDNGDGTWTLTPDADWNGSVNLSYDVNDGTTTTGATGTVTVDPINDAPVISLGTVADIDIGSSTYSEPPNLDNQIVTLADGKIATIYGGSGGTAYVHILNADGSDYGPAFDIPTTDDYDSSLVALDDGTFLVVSKKTFSGTNIQSLRMDVDGNQIGSAHDLSGNIGSGDYVPATTQLADGSVIISWHQADADGWGIFARHLDTNGDPTGAAFQVNTTTTGDQTLSAIGSLDNGGYVITWISAGQDGDGNGVYAQIYDASDTPVGSEFLVNTVTTSDQDTPSVTGLNNGNFVVTWESAGQDGDGETIMGQIFDATGARVGTEFQINQTTAGDQITPRITALADGGFVVTWGSDNVDSSYKAVVGRVYNADGTPRGDEFQVNTYEFLTQSKPDVEALDDGGFVIMWHTSATVSVKTFDADGTPRDTAAYTEGDAPVQVAESLTLSDVDSGTLDGATITITGFVSGEDVLHFTDQNGITGSWDSGTGILTLSGSASLANYETALESITYENTSDAPTGSSRTITFQVDDGAGANNLSNVYSQDVNIYAANDAPDVSGPTVFNTNEDTDIVLTEVQLLANASDADGDSLSVTNLSADQGTLVDNGNGIWTFTPDADWNGTVNLTYDVDDGTVTSAATGTITVDPVNDIIGLDSVGGSDSLIGTTGVDYISGLSGDDYLFGNADADTLDGGAGADTLDGGTGLDTASFESASSGLTADLSAGTTSEGDILTNIENLVGSEFSDTLVGDTNNNIIEGLGGGDTMTGGGGQDTFVFGLSDTDGDTITDFTQGDDVLDVSVFGLTDMSGLTVTNDGMGNAMIILPSGDDIVLTGIDENDVNNSDFVF